MNGYLSSKMDNLETVTRISEAATTSELRQAVKHTLSSIWNGAQSVVYLSDSQDFYLNENQHDLIPRHGIARECIESREAKQCNSNTSDPILQVLRWQNHSQSNSLTHVNCVPVVDHISGKVIAVLAIESSKEICDLKALDAVKDQIVGCYRRLCKCQRENSYTPASPSLQNSVNVNGPVDQREAILRLCGELYDQDATLLQLKIVKCLEDQTDAECAFILLVVPETNDLICQVVGSRILQEEVSFPVADSGFSTVLETKKPISLQDIPLDKRKDIEDSLGIPLKSLLCVPVNCRNQDSLLALACVANKENSDKFTGDDLQTIVQCFQYTATILRSTLAFQNERKLKLQTQAMLQVARNLFTHLDDLTKLLREIMQEARNLTQAERCSVFLIDKETDELVAKVFDGITTNDSEEQSEIRMPSTRGIAGHVATTGTLLNIKDAYSHPLFFRGIDDSTGFKTRNILCFPIKNEKGDVLGVAQLCNKKNGPYFSTFDEEVASAFAVYCCISISHCLMYKKLQLSQHRNRLTNELMIYHMQVSPDDVTMLVQSEIPPSKKWSEDFDKFPYPPREIPENDTPLACLTMFEDLGFISRWRIKKETLIRFTLMVRKGYRNPPYHNWMHAFAVAHFCFLCVKNLNLTEYLDDLELFALFVSCLGHDIDHRGTNNQYQVASKSVLAALYSSEGSVMERHHFAQTMCIVNTEGCNIFENLPSKDYTTVLDLVRDIILATDLAHHLKILGSLKEMAAGGYDKTNIRHRKNLLCLLMTASDLSDQTKPWNYTKHVAALIYREFFSQGDLEKALGQKPIEMMDRERARIPDLQIGFLDHIALPVYRVLSDIFPAADLVRNTVTDNRRHWEKICALIKIRRGGSCEQMSYDQILALEEEEADAEIESYEQKQRQAEQNGR